MQSTKVIMTIWVKWKKPMKSAITIDLEDVEDAEDLDSTGDVYIKFERLFNSLIMEFFEGSNIEELIQAWTGINWDRSGTLHAIFNCLDSDKSTNDLKTSALVLKLKTFQTCIHRTFEC